MDNNAYDNYINNLNMNEVMKKFLDIYKPGDNLIKPEQRFIDEAKKIVPKEIIDIWTNYGFGEYGNGIIKMVNPEEYMGILYEWIGKEDFTKIPLMVDAFGDIFYYRYLGNGINDISVVDIHYGEIRVLTYSYQEFFDKYMLDFKTNDIYLRRSLYEEAIKKCGKLNIDEVYYFKPAIKIAGYEHIKFIEKDTCKASQYFLLKLQLNENSLINKYKDNNSLMIINNVFPTENGLTPVLGNIVKGKFNIEDSITIIKSDNQTLNGIIKRINVGKETLNSIDKKEKVIIYLKNVSMDDIKNVSLINRNVIIK